MVFYFAYYRDALTNTRVATYPGVVAVFGDPLREQATQVYVLKHWKRGPQFRLPARVEIFVRYGAPSSLERIVLAFPSDVRANPQLEDGLLLPPDDPSGGRRR